MNKRNLTLLSVVVLGSGTGAVAWRQLTKPSIENDEVAYYIEAARPLYEALPRLPVTGDGDDGFEDELYRALASAEVVGAEPDASGGYVIDYELDVIGGTRPAVDVVTEAMHERLLREASGLLAVRFASSGPEAYIEYRAAQNATLSRERYDKHFPGMFDAVAERIVGADRVQTATPRSLLEAVFDQHLPDEIATDSGMAVAYGVDAPSAIIADLTQAQLGYTGWSGGLSLGFAPMTTRPETRAELLASFGPLPCAYVGVVTFYPDRSPRPLALWFDWHPTEKRWVLMRVFVMNFPNAEAMASMYPEF